MKTLKPLIDADGIVYRAGFAADGQVAKHHEIEELDYLHFALANTKTIMNEILDYFQTDDYHSYLSGDGNFREQVATLRPYKGNRSHKKPKYYKEIQRYLIEEWKSEVIHGREADDAVATEQWSNKDRSTVIVTNDKDLNMIPGWHYNWVKKELFDVRMHDANLHLFRQMLEGDLVDNIPGIKGVGPITVNKLFDGCSGDIDCVREAVQDYYLQQYGDDWKAAYEEVARLLWMERVEGEPCPFL